LGSTPRRGRRGAAGKSSAEVWIRAVKNVKLRNAKHCPVRGASMMPGDFENCQQENADKAEKAASRLFPDVKWEHDPKLWGERIYIAPNRKRGAKSNFADELRDAQILRDLGSTVYLVPENTRIQNERQYDAIVDGLQMEFKNIRGESPETLIDHFYRSRGQAPNVFMNLEESPLSKHKIISIFIGARNSPKYNEKNKFPEGGTVVLKISGHTELYRMDVDDIK